MAEKMILLDRPCRLPCLHTGDKPQIDSATPRGVHIRQGGVELQIYLIPGKLSDEPSKNKGIHWSHLYYSYFLGILQDEV